MSRLTMTTAFIALGFISLAVVTTAFAGETPSPTGAKVFFKNLKDGATVSSPVKVEFGIEGMEVVAAGTERANTGHHHLFIDRAPLGQGESGADEMNANILSDEHNVHYGKAQTEATIELKPGKHTLQMVLGDKDHIPHNPPVASEVITITVQ
jgi:Domain of unknown function (DUF4399)